METFVAIVQHPFTWGLVLGLVFAALAWKRLAGVQAEFRRFRQLLGDKLEVESRQLSEDRAAKERLREENENLRMKVAQVTQKPDRKINRDLQILLRAEQKMLVGAPGFAAAWEKAKDEAANDLEGEESGLRKPRELLARIVAPLRQSHDDNGDSESSRKMLERS